MAAAGQEALYSKQLLRSFGTPQKYKMRMERTTRVVSDFNKTQSSAKGESKLRTFFTSFGTRRKMRLFQFTAFLLKNGIARPYDIIARINYEKIQNSLDDSRFHAFISSLSGVLEFRFKIWS